MTDKHVQQEAPQTNMEKDPSTWVTGDEPMTGAQMSYLKTLSEQAKVPFDEALTKAAASLRIDELQQRTGRGTHAHAAAPSPAHGVARSAADSSDRRPEPPPADDASYAGEEDPSAADGDTGVADALRGEARR